MNEDLLVPLSAVIVVGIAAQWLAWRVKSPSILLLLLAGFLAGPVTGLLDPDALLGDLLLPLVSLSVALILYEGGLTLRFRELHGAGAFLWTLVTVGAGVAWLLTAAAARILLGLPLPLAVLLAAVLVVTGPTVILPLLREIRPRGPVGAILKWEGIVIDPIGAMLAVLVFEVILIGGLEEAAGHVALAVVKTVFLSGGIGVAAGIALALLLRAFWIPDYLDNPVSLMFVVIAYTVAQHVQEESGLYAATAMGMTLANQRIADVRHIVEFKENLRVLLISSLFILLAARLDFATVSGLGLNGLAFLAALIVLVRPVSVAATSAVSTLLGAKLTGKSLVFLSMIAPRGIVAAAVSAVFALRLENAGFEGAATLVPITFIVIIGTVAFCSIAAPLSAVKLGVADPDPQGLLIVGAHAWGRAAAEALRKSGFRVLLVDTNRENIAAARMAGLETYSGSVLAEYALDELDLGGVGRLIAATPNDWINVLTVQRFARIFGRSGVYQTPSHVEKQIEKDKHRHLHGRWVFGPDVTFEKLTRHAARGAVGKATPLTEEFTFDSYRQVHGDRAIPMFLIREKKRLIVLADEQTVEPRAGDVVIALVIEQNGPAKGEGRSSHVADSGREVSHPA